MNNSIFNYINSLKEDDFSKEVILELFKELGYERTVFNGGSYEFGKDLIFTIRAGLAECRIHIQSKKLSNCKKSDIYKISHQLNQCLKDGTFNGAGNRIRADKVYLAFPEQEEDRFLSEIITALDNKDGRFEVLDGVKITQTIESLAPKLKEKLCSYEERFTKNTFLEKTNMELLQSIKAKKVIDIEQLYSDLSFYMGSVDSKHFFHSKLILADKFIEIDIRNWESLKSVIDYCQKKWGLSLVEENLYEIEEKVESQKLNYLRQNKNDDENVAKVAMETAKYEKESTTLLTLNQTEIKDFIETITSRFNNDCIDLNKASNPQAILNFLESTIEALKFYKFVDENKSIFNQFFHLNNDEENITNFSISPFLILDSRLDIALYGQAGAGKTTTLSQYAKYKIQKEASSVIYLKLNKIYTKYADLKFYNKAENLIYQLVCINSDEELNVNSLNELKSFFTKDKTLILDGLDEVYKALPKLLEDIELFKKEHPTVQIIISSRDCVSYLDKISFLGMTLEPFTTKQLNDFAEQYLGEIKYKSIKKHLNSGSLNSVIRTPLLATVACELFSQGIKSFENENEIYDCRLRLLTGEYDFAKGVERLINHHNLLQKIMVQLAYHMHSNNRRFVDYSAAIKHISYTTALETEKIESCFSDLLNDANLLFLNRSNNTLSFGHFRFQEHLTSKALETEKNFNWEQILNNDFWRGSLELFAMSNSIEFIFDILGDDIMTYQQKLVIGSMINRSPIKSNKGLKDFLNFEPDITISNFQDEYY